MDIYEEARRVQQMSEVYGGSFAKALFNSLHYADIQNIQKIRNTWSEEWNKFLRFYDMSKDKEE